MKCSSASRSASFSRLSARSRTASAVRRYATAALASVLSTRILFLQKASLARLELSGIGLALGEIAGGLLGVDFDPGLAANEPLRDLDPLDHLDAALHERLELRVAHGDEAVDARDAQPMQHVGHQLLEAHVLQAGDAFGALEISRGAVAALLPFAGVVDQELGHFAEA